MNGNEGGRAAPLLGAGYKPLSRTWAKAEILAGQASAGIGLFLGFWTLARPISDQNWLVAACGLVLFVLGNYLALAGHRSHLYQSLNEQPAYLAAEIRRLQEKVEPR
jgi:hypothetical protein